MNTVKFTITPEDLETAKSLRLTKPPSQCCVVTLAAKRQFKDVGYSVAGCIYPKYDRRALFEYSSVLYKVMNLFDRRRYDEIELPMTVELRRI